MSKEDEELEGFEFEEEPFIVEGETDNQLTQSKTKNKKNKKKNKLSGKIKTLPLWQKIVFGFIAFLIIFIMLVVIIFFVMKATGRSSIMKNTIGIKPFLKGNGTQVDKNNEYIINPDNMTDISEYKNILSISEDGKHVVSLDGMVIELAEGEAILSDDGICIVNSGGTYMALAEGEYKLSNDGKSVIYNYNVYKIIDRTTNAVISDDFIIPVNTDKYDIIYKGVKYKYNTSMINLLILGIDNNEVVTPAPDGISGGQSDALLLVAINPKTKVIDIIVIPRDTITKLWIYNEDGSFEMTGYAQICLQHGYGDGMSLSNERTKQAVSNLFYNLPIQSCTSINMGAVSQLNDAVGGVTVTSLDSFEIDGYVFKEGETVTLRGQAAYSYVHYRDCSRHFTASERLERQKQYMNSFAAQAMSKIKKNVATVVDIYNVISRYVVTDLNASEMVDVATEAAGCTLGEIRSLEGYTSTAMTYERYYLDEAALKQLIIEKFYYAVD